MGIKSRGFTIVELLIVIVIIAILAAITIVAYNGIQNRAKTSVGQSAANVLAKKSMAFYTINSIYPTYCQLVTNSVVPTGSAPAAGTAGAGTCAAGGATAGAESKLDSVASVTPTSSNTGGGYTSTVSNSNKVIGYFTCGTGSEIYYWDYTGSGVVASMDVGPGC